MRDLSFFLRLHALPPLARPSGSLRKPYLPLEVRYIIRPTGEVLLYVSNALNRKTSYEDLSLFGNHRLYSVFLGKQRAGISSPEDMPLIIPNVNAGIIYDVDLFASKNLHDRFIDKIDGRPCTIKYENAHYIISMERVE